MRSIPARELDEEYAYYLVEPYGEEWRQTGEICATVVNAAGAYEREPLEAEDFLPVRLPKRRQSIDEQETIFDAAVAYGRGLTRRGTHHVDDR
ncbi:MAG TPA: hypothetical protein VGG64_29875 [Pirellulales bacterium]